MIENSLMQSNFLGRDGFKWWVGQVAPEEAQGEQINGDGWGNRVKVRIMGYHPDNEVELKNEDLPWAHILKSPEGGSGRAGRGKPTQILLSDNVLGFFLDGDTAQQPVILGVFSSSIPLLKYQKIKHIHNLLSHTQDIPVKLNQMIILHRVKQVIKIKNQVHLIDI